MALKKLWLAPLAIACGAAYASPDTLYMEDGRRIRGEMISANAGTIVFNQDSGAQSRARRIRVNRADVVRIDFTDSEYYGDDDATTPGTWDANRDIVVRSDQPWTATGLRVRAGEVFRIEATGFVSWGPGRNDDANGEARSPYNANRPLPNRAGGALIGRVGNGEPFFIGTGMQSFRAGSSGELFLGVNDDFVRDNSGSFRVFVTPR